MTTAPEVNRTRSTSSIRLLLRLRPYVAPAKLPLIVSGVFALLSMLCGLTIPLVLRRILDGPIANRNLAELPWLLAAVITLGLIEPCALLLMAHNGEYRELLSTMDDSDAEEVA
jgi:ATP-binding cassette subfamily B protein